MEKILNKIHTSANTQEGQFDACRKHGIGQNFLLHMKLVSLEAGELNYFVTMGKLL